MAIQPEKRKNGLSSQAKRRKDPKIPGERQRPSRGVLHGRSRFIRDRIPLDNRTSKLESQEGRSMPSVAHSASSQRPNLFRFYMLFLMVFPLVLVAEGVARLGACAFSGGKQEALSVGFSEVREKVSCALSYAFTS
jgi:hypothetical protein